MKFNRRSNAKTHQGCAYGSLIASNNVRGKTSTELFKHQNKSKIDTLPLEWFLSNLSPNSSSEDEELMTEVLEKIRKPFEDLASLILDLDENSRVYYLTETIMVSFLSPDPEIIIQDWVDRM